MSRRYGDSVAHSFGLDRAPLLATRSLQVEQIVATHIECGIKKICIRQKSPGLCRGLSLLERRDRNKYQYRSRQPSAKSKPVTSTESTRLRLRPNRRWRRCVPQNSGFICAVGRFHQAKIFSRLISAMPRSIQKSAHGEIQSAEINM